MQDSFAAIAAAQEPVLPAPAAPRVARVLARTRTKTLVDLPQWRHQEPAGGCCLVPRPPRQWLVPRVDVSSSSDEENC